MGPEILNGIWSLWSGNVLSARNVLNINTQSQYSSHFSLDGLAHQIIFKREWIAANNVSFRHSRFSFLWWKCSRYHRLNMNYFCKTYSREVGWFGEREHWKQIVDLGVQFCWDKSTRQLSKKNGLDQNHMLMLVVLTNQLIPLPWIKDVDPMAV